MTDIPEGVREAMKAAISDKKTPYGTRRNKAHDDGLTWEVVRQDNPDWREVITDDQTVMRRFANSQDANALCADLETEFRLDAALSALREAGYEVRRSDHIAALESLATGAADILPLVSEWFHASEAERAAEGIDWECRAHMGVLAVMHEAQALAPPARPNEQEQGE